MITGVAGEIQVASTNRGLNGGIEVLDCPSSRLVPEADVCADNELDLGLVDHELPLRHQIIAQPSELKASPVISIEWAQVHAETAICHDRSVAVTIANRHVDHVAIARPAMDVSFFERRSRVCQQRIEQTQSLIEVAAQKLALRLLET